MTKTPAIACVGLLLLAGCLENEENILVRPDGSVVISLRSKGDRADLLSGSPIPQFAPWIAEDLETAARFGREEVPASEEGKVDKEEMRVRGEFARIEDVPSFYTPPQDPYRSAALERSSSLKIEDLGKRKIYSFERRFRLPGPRIADPMHGFDTTLPKDLEEILEAKGEPTESHWRWLHDNLLERHDKTVVSYAREAFLPLFADSSVQISSESLSDCIKDCQEGLEEIFAVSRLRAIYDELRRTTKPRGQRDQKGEVNPLQTLEHEVRETLRSSLNNSLAKAKLTDEQRNRCLARLEWLLAASDHGDDLADESFRVELTLPGQVIAGNFGAQATGGKVRWEFKGSELNDREIILRATSVVE